MQCFLHLTSQNCCFQALIWLILLYWSSSCGFLQIAFALSYFFSYLFLRTRLYWCVNSEHLMRTSASGQSWFSLERKHLVLNQSWLLPLSSASSHWLIHNLYGIFRWWKLIEWSRSLGYDFKDCIFSPVPFSLAFSHFLCILGEHCFSDM